MSRVRFHACAGCGHVVNAKHLDVRFEPAREDGNKTVVTRLVGRYSCRDKVKCADQYRRSVERLFLSVPREVERVAQ